MVELTDLKKTVFAASGLTVKEYINKIMAEWNEEQKTNREEINESSR